MAKQNFTPGALVNIGFLRGLRVVAKIPTPGDHAPDAYALRDESNDRWYRFVPHLGISRVAGQEEALAS